MAAVQIERAAIPITFVRELVLEVVRLECQMLWRSSAALCKICLARDALDRKAACAKCPWLSCGALCALALLV